MRQFYMPCADARIVSRQGWRQLPGEDFRWHNGVDFVPAGRQAEGEPLLAVGDGIIRAAVESGTVGFRGYGRAVLLELAPSVLALYGHNRENLVTVGQRVQAGQTIATMGRTSGRGGDPTVLIGAAHVHFEFARRWPITSNQTFERYDVLSTFASAGIVEINGRLVYQEGPPPYIRPSGLARVRHPYDANRPEPAAPGVGGVVDLALAAIAVKIINEGGD